MEVLPVIEGVGSGFTVSVRSIIESHPAAVVPSTWYVPAVLYVVPIALYVAPWQMAAETGMLLYDGRMATSIEAVLEQPSALMPVTT